jgi:HEAT repeat protein
MLRKPENLEKNASGVLALLADPVAQVRTAAVWAALRLPGDTARQQVRALLSSAEEPMRFAAACALSDVQDAAALPELIAALREEHRRQEALSALMSLGDPGALPHIAALFEEESLGEFDRTLVAAALARFGDARGGAHLVERIEHDSDDRPVAAEWAGRLGVQDAISALTELADEEGDPAQGAAMRALGRLHAPGAEERLLRVAGSEDTAEDLRMDAAEGLAELGTQPALELLKKLAAQEPGELAQLCQELLLEVELAK